MMRRGLVFALAVLQVQGALASQAPVGLLRLTEERGERFVRAREILERRLVRWLEDRGGRPVVRRQDPVDPQWLQDRLAQGRFRRALEGAESDLRGGGAPELPQAPTPLAPLLEARYRQVSLWALWVRGNPQWKGALKAWADSIPLGQEPSFVSGFPEALRREFVASRLIGAWDCWAVPPEGGRWGGGGVRLSLRTGPSYDLLWEGPGGIQRVKARCHRPGQATLEPRGPEAAGGTLAVVAPRPDGFGLYLVTQGLGADEIPLERPLSVNELLDRPLEGELPVSDSKFHPIRDAHGLIAGPWSGPPARVEAEGGAPRWYNDWRTWAVAGGLLTGALVVFLASRGHSVATQQNGLRIQID